MKKLFGWFAVVAVLVSFAMAAEPVAGPQWLAVKSGKHSGISGMARLEGDGNRPSFLVVHDNKKPDQARFAVVNVALGTQDGPIPVHTTVLYVPLAWPANAAPPVDLEALTPVPGTPDTFLALASAGDVSEVKLVLKEQRIEVVSSFRLPGIRQNDNYEGIALYPVGGKLMAAWGHRGEGASPGILHWGFIQLPGGTITETGSSEIVVPWPEGANLRHISDIVIDQQGNVYVSAASDAGDDGPFNGAIYKVGSFAAVPEGKVSFQKLEKPTELNRSQGYKIEGLVLMPGATPIFAAGTDDENKGSSLYIAK